MRRTISSTDRQLTDESYSVKIKNKNVYIKSLPVIFWPYFSVTFSHSLMWNKDVTYQRFLASTRGQFEQHFTSLYFFFGIIYFQCLTMNMLIPRYGLQVIVAITLFFHFLSRKLYEKFVQVSAHYSKQREIRTTPISVCFFYLEHISEKLIFLKIKKSSLVLLFSLTIV